MSTGKMMIAFNVAYTLNEYLDFVQNHAVVVMNQELTARGKTPLKKLPFIMLPIVSIPAAIGFYFKKRAMPVCEFKIDNVGIVRITADGPYAMPWVDVVAIHQYPRGYLVASKHGAMPLPHRCLDNDQAIYLATLIDRRRSELKLINSN